MYSVKERENWNHGNQGHGSQSAGLRESNSRLGMDLNIEANMDLGKGVNSGKGKKLAKHERLIYLYKKNKLLNDKAD